MKNLPLISLLLLLTSMVFAQQQGQQPNGPPQTTPPTFPRHETPERQMPPDQNAQPLSTAQVQEQIQQGLNSEPALSNSKVSVKTNEDSVVLSGTVESERQHELALRIAQSYAGDRKVVDKIRVQQQT
jgi:hyperosmotically inducible protein